VALGGSVTVSPLDLAQVLNSGHVSGTVSLQGGGSASGVTVSVPGTSYIATSDASGHYSLNLPTGSYTLQASAAGYTPASTTVTVTLGGNVTASLLSLSAVMGVSPSITSVSPGPVLRGNVLTISGINFGAAQGSSEVRIGGVEAAQYLAWSDTQIQVRTAATTPLGNVNVTVGTAGLQSAPATLRVVTPAVHSISAGQSFSLAVRDSGTVIAWGARGSVPAGLTNVVAVAAGGDQTLALKSDGSVVAWGRDDAHQTDVPTGLMNVVAVAAGGNHSLALKSDGTVAAWGRDDVHQTDVPAGLTNVVAIAAGLRHNLALRSDGTVVAWGDDPDHQTDVPAGLTNVVAVAAGIHHSMALRSDGTVVAWGDLEIVPAGLTNVVAVAAGGDHSLALRSDGTVVAWGFDQTDVPAGLSVLLP